MLRTDKSVTQSQIYYFVHLLALCPSRVTLRPEFLGNRIRSTLLSRINVLHDRPSAISLRCLTLGIWPSLLLQYLAACGENNLSFSLVISRERIGRHLLNADLCVHIAANPDIGQIRILKTTSSNRTFGSHLKCGFVRLHWFYRTERSDFTETSVQCERGSSLPSPGKRVTWWATAHAHSPEDDSEMLAENSGIIVVFI